MSQPGDFITTEGNNAGRLKYENSNKLVSWVGQYEVHVSYAGYLVIRYTKSSSRPVKIASTKGFKDILGLYPKGELEIQTNGH